MQRYFNLKFYARFFLILLKMLSKICKIVMTNLSDRYIYFIRINTNLEYLKISLAIM